MGTSSPPGPAPALGTLEQLLWVLLPRWEGRVQRAGPQISLRNVLGLLEVAIAEPLPRPGHAAGKLGSGRAMQCPRSTGRRTSLSLGPGAEDRGHCQMTVRGAQGKSIWGGQWECQQGPLRIR